MGFVLSGKCKGCESSYSWGWRWSDVPFLCKPCDTKIYEKQKNDWEKNRIAWKKLQNELYYNKNIKPKLDAYKWLTSQSSNDNP